MCILLKSVFLFLFSGFLLASMQAAAQAVNPRINAHHTHSWLQYFGNHKFTDRWGLHVEAQLRRADFMAEWQQVLLRAGIDYHPHPQVRISLGYCFVETYPYGDYPVANAFPEHRIWQNILFTHPVGRFTFQHRLRPEQRFLGNAATGRFENGRYENRFRYMFRAIWPLQGKTMDLHEFYLAFQNEIFINAGKQVSYNVFDQNRLYGAIGFNLGKPGRIEVGYMNQVAGQRNLRPNGQLVFENNHTLMVAYFCNVNFYKAQ